MGEQLKNSDEPGGQSRDPNRYRPDGQLGEAVAGARRVRWCARSAALVIIGVCAVIGGEEWLIGAFLGGLVVEINLSLLIRALARSANWAGRSLGPTLVRFYLIFGATVAVCLLIVRSHFGHPLAFLLGLLSFLIGLGLGLLSFAVSKPKSGFGSE